MQQSHEITEDRRKLLVQLAEDAYKHGLLDGLNQMATTFADIAEACYPNDTRYTAEQVAFVIRQFAGHADLDLPGAYSREMEETK